MESLDLKSLREFLREGRISWRKHVLQRMAERGMKQDDIISVLLSGERIEDYPNDKPYPSALFFGFVSHRPLHALAALDQVNKIAYIITAYEPTLDVFKKDYKTRITR